MKATWNLLPLWMQARITTDPDTGCWIWNGAPDKGGYRRIKWRGRTSRAHRVVYELLRGDLPDLPLDHLCRNRACCNPDHLEPVTPVENVRRSQSAAGATLRGVCQRGHDLTAPGALRQGECLACYSARRAIARQRAREAARLDPSIVPHGSQVGYGYYACRCAECRSFVSDYHRQRKRSAK